MKTATGYIIALIFIITAQALFFVSYHNVDMCHNMIVLNAETGSDYVETDVFMRHIDGRVCYNRFMYVVFATNFFLFFLSIFMAVDTLMRGSNDNNDTGRDRKRKVGKRS